MMNIASSTGRVVKRALKWTALAGAILVMGQATALAEDSVSVLMKQPLPDIAGKVTTMLTVGEMMHKHDMDWLPVVENRDSRRLIGVIRSERMLRRLVAHMSDSSLSD